uniref:Plant heme peroxidase family profile domain-containing protein n=1 Tax=Pyramimonas obovata TaxID=1411642 RepID=A0A7S0N9C7_9CHLO|mmetsp:Transcript_22177/g.48673  ORF Transcript_22177/g.48673 Transcript_22177/m.48673 type:complete len:368 (+) Transcript_22177:126-1229(+)|eukprot:CAMPEP_0118933182 /NCGR_PEP_ID=MMETSP1169-20130426/11535_1 /TAXON_ID=36882 /ORGANISM="Pyramimonas obovata, Strain CCMP722" /LENGTH=367 /DNA_ID=CAMNT_0006875915 /DNA_START=103 /DNA_END=1206 /DNA_ORIENTATION=-
MQATAGCTRVVGPAAPKVGSSSTSRVAHVARPAKGAARSLRLNAVAQNSSSSPEDVDRRAFLRALSMGAISVASTLAVSEDANALNTYTTPKPFKADFEKYNNRPGATVNPMQMAHMRAEFRDVAKGELMAAMPGIEGAYPGMLKLAFTDAATFDIWQAEKPNGVAPSGGANGSVRFADEEKRPEVAAYKPLLAALEPVKESIDSKWAALAKSKGSSRAPDPISWADLITMAAVVATIQKWGGSPEAGGFPVRQGRVDAVGSDPSGRTLPLDADLRTAQAWFAKRNIKKNEMLPVWMEVTDNKASLSSDLQTVKLMDAYKANPAMFQKDFITGFTKLTSLGSTFDGYAYFYDESPFAGKEKLGNWSY